MQKGRHTGFRILVEWNGKSARITASHEKGSVLFSPVEGTCSSALGREGLVSRLTLSRHSSIPTCLHSWFPASRDHRKVQGFWVPWRIRMDVRWFSFPLPVIEKFTENTRFCLICNYLSKIIPALQSRCTRFRFGPLTPELMVPRLEHVAEKEK